MLDHSQEESEPDQSLSSRLGGFLSSTLNNAKTIINEVFEEGKEEVATPDSE